MKFRASGFLSKPSALTNRAVSLTLVGDAAHFLLGKRIAFCPDQSRRGKPMSSPDSRPQGPLWYLVFPKPQIGIPAQTVLPPVCRGTRQQEEGDGGKVLEDDCAGDDCRPSFVWWRLSSGDGHTSSSGYWQF